MEKLILENPAKDINVADIQEIEETIGVKIPPQVVKFYMEHNGGRPSNAHFYMEKQGVETKVRVFYPIKFKLATDEDDLTTIEKIYEFFIGKNTFDKKYLPFASDWGDNFFCINTKTNNIVLIYMDLGDINQNKDAIRFLSKDFDDFVKALYMESIEDEDV